MELDYIKNMGTLFMIDLVYTISISALFTYPFIYLLPSALGTWEDLFLN